MAHNFLKPAVIWTIAITVASLASFTKMPKVTVPGKDKTVHFVFYFVLVLLWFLALKSKHDNKKIIFYIAVSAILYGILMEIMQWLFTQNRQADFYDIIANTLGVFLAVLTIYLFSTKTKTI